MRFSKKKSKKHFKRSKERFTMRKNNFLKIFVSLVMCLMLVLSLVACGDTEVKDGVDGKDGVGIAGVTYEDGKLTINYTNNKTDSFDLVAGSATCEHNYSNPVELVKHAIDANGTYIKVCGECGAAAVVEDIIHNTVATEVAATCIEYGYTVDLCACGYEANKVMGTEYADHTMTTNGYVVADNTKTICVDGGTLLQYCTYCKLTAQTETEGIGHKVEKWELAKENKPTVALTGKLTGKCVQCNADVEEVLPALNDEDYAVEVIKAKVDCSDPAGEAKYTYTFQGQTFEIEGDIAIVDHVLAGKPQSELAWVVGGVEVYDVNIKGIKLMAGETLACETVMESAYFMCEKCNVAVQVNAFRCHAGELKANTTPAAATCTTTGSKIVAKCTYGCEGENLTATVPATGHHFAYQVKLETINEKETVKSISKVCDNKCGTVENVPFVGEATYKVIAESTCIANGEAELTYKPDVASKVVTKKVAIAYADHKLNGALLPVKDETGAFINLDSKLAGVKLFAGEKVEECEDVADGYFMCDVCAEAVAAKVELKHNVLAWAWAKDADENEIKPTCSTNGKLVGKCTACEANIEDTTSDAVKATGKHTLVYGFEFIGDDAWYMDHECTGCDAYTVTDKVVYGVKTSTVKSTCSVEGTKTYSYKLDGKPVTATEKLPLADHTLNGELVETSVLDFDLVPGLKLFAGEKISCKQGEDHDADGYFMCEACNEAVAVTVVKNHRGSWAWVEKDADGEWIVPTCEAGAKRVMAECLDCGEKNINDVAPALGHEAAVKFDTYINADEKLVGDYIVYCARCDVEGYTGDIADVTEFAGLELDDAKSIVKPTCKADGSATFVVEVEDEEFTIVAVIAKLAHLTQAKVKSTTNMFVLSRVDDQDEVEYYAVFECPTCGDFYLLENTVDFDFTSADKADVEKAIADFKACLAEKEAEEEEKNGNWCDCHSK
jgi:hypothetical protein